MAFGDVLRSATFTGDDIADLIEGIGVAGHPLAWTNWTPSSYSAAGAMTYTSVTLEYSRYIQIGKLILYMGRFYGTIGGTPNVYVYLNGFPISLNTTAFQQGWARIDLHASEAGVCFVSGSDQLAAGRISGSNWSAGSTRYFTTNLILIAA